MARSSKYTNPAAGFSELGKVFKSAPEQYKKEIVKAVQQTVNSVALNAKQRAASNIRTGALVRHIEGKVFKNTGIGIVGIAKGAEALPGKGGSALTAKGARLARPSHYAHLLEFGSKRQRAFPFLIPAAENNRGSFAAAVNAACKRVEQALASNAPAIVVNLPSRGNTGLL